MSFNSGKIPPIKEKAAASRTQLGEENIVVCEAMDGMGNPTMVAAVSCLELQF